MQIQLEIIFLKDFSFSEKSRAFAKALLPGYGFGHQDYL
jgi:hypothetical protein